MSGLRITCIICTEEYTANDDIYSTSCGHLYHYRCMMQWQSRSTSCPQCREHNPTKHKVFFNIENDEQAPSAPPVDEDLKAKLESSCDKIQDLQALLQVSELNFYHLQEQYTIEQDSRKELELRLAQLNDNEANFLNLHALYSESEDRVKILKEENDRLSIENEYKLKELDLRATEITMLKESLEVNLATSPTDVNNAKIATLEQRLKHVTGELQKEISNSTQLAIDKIKLQSYIQRMEMQSNISSAAVNSDNSKEKNKNIPNTKPIPNKHQDTATQQQRQNSDNNKILLHGLPLNKMNGTLIEAVILIADKINVNLAKEDIKNVQILNNATRRIPNMISACVEFKTADKKIQFLHNRGILRVDDTFGKVGIKDHIDEKIHAIFAYANKKLRGKVFGYIVCTNNVIIANKRRGDGADIIIRSKEHVDELLVASLLPKNEPTTYMFHDKIDESYYKIE